MSLSNRQKQQNIRFVKDRLYKGIVYRSNNFVLDCSPKKRWHEIGKFLDGCEIRNEGGTFYMEAEIVDPIAKKRKRADTIYADFKRVIERQHNESDESIQEKRIFYENLGFDFEVRKVIDPVGVITRRINNLKDEKKYAKTIEMELPLENKEIEVLEWVLTLLEVK